MREMSEAMQARLHGEATHLCSCWKILRRDGVVQGFTDHDDPLVFDGVTFATDGGLHVRGQEDRLGLAGGKSDVGGALLQFSIEEAALWSGVFDGASVETWLVDWCDPSFRILMNVEVMGEVRRADHIFSAELRSLAQVFEQETGRRFMKSCSADLGDVHCGVNLNHARYLTQTSIQSVQDAAYVAVMLTGFADRWFANGQMRVISGAQKGTVCAIKAHRQDDDRAQIALWTPLSPALAVGDQIELRAGCDKSFATCGTKFSNRINFRGFPHIPGNDLLMSVASKEIVMDGGSLFS
jgi:uncharacterized phage protein (TIGR02218 family)